MSSLRWRSVLTGLGLALAIGAGEAAAQGLREVRPKGMLGGGIIVARPVGEFQDFVDWGGGLNLFGVIGLAGSDQIGLRLEGAFIIYGHESYERPFSSTIQRVWLDVTTTNSIATFGIGPQITLGRGPLRPYAYGTLGFSYFSTSSSLQGSNNAEPFASSTNYDDATLALSGGAGLLLRLTNGRKPVALDFSVNSLYNGEAEYLRKGSIQELADGTVVMVPIRSQANLVTFRMGVTASLF